MATSSWLHKVLLRPVSIAPLAVFRIVFGLIMLVGVVRFWSLGWIDAQYVQPQLHFKYFGFYWLPEPADWGYYALFGLMMLSAIGIALGAAYRFSATVFFLAFTYIELVDVTYYLNHYYFVSLVALIMIFLPAHRGYSVDVLLGWTKKQHEVRSVNINVLKFQLGLVYFLAGVAKLNYDWLFNAMPLSLWLPAQDHLPVIGPMLAWTETAYAFSWFGVLYDLSIPFLLLWSRTRAVAYAAVVAFHLMTWWLFQIGMFPFIMIGATLIFFPAAWHERLLQAFSSWTGQRPRLYMPDTATHAPMRRTWKITLLYGIVGLFAAVQIAFPFRHMLYSGNPFWHEQGYRFGWRVMLMEKAGYAQFQVVDHQERTIHVDNRDFLTPAQEKMMSTQPDLMLQYARFLKTHYAQQGIAAGGVRAHVYVTFNGRPSRPFIDPTVDLASIQDSWEEKDWILPYKETGT